MEGEETDRRNEGITIAIPDEDEYIVDGRVTAVPVVMDGDDDEVMEDDERDGTAMDDEEGGMENSG